MRDRIIATIMLFACGVSIGGMAAKDGLTPLMIPPAVFSLAAAIGLCRRTDRASKSPS